MLPSNNSMDAVDYSDAGYSAQAQARHLDEEASPFKETNFAKYAALSAAASVNESISQAFFRRYAEMRNANKPSPDSPTQVYFNRGLFMFQLFNVFCGEWYESPETTRVPGWLVAAVASMDVEDLVVFAALQTAELARRRGQVQGPFETFIQDATSPKEARAARQAQIKYGADQKALELGEYSSPPAIKYVPGGVAVFVSQDWDKLTAAAKSTGEPAVTTYLLAAIFWDERHRLSPDEWVNDWLLLKAGMDPSVGPFQIKISTAQGIINSTPALAQHKGLSSDALAEKLKDLGFAASIAAFYLADLVKKYKAAGFDPSNNTYGVTWEELLGTLFHLGGKPKPDPLPDPRGEQIAKWAVEFKDMWRW